MSDGAKSSPQAGEPGTVAVTVTGAIPGFGTVYAPSTAENAAPTPLIDTEISGTSVSTGGLPG